MNISIELRRRIFSPWVMRAAWLKTLTWYRTGEWYDPAELLAWKADPWGHLADLADEIIRGEYRPDPFPLVPYPKKEDVIRHYTMPSVRDQVAFMAFLVLLGPFLEAAMSRASFGNRLYRPRVLREELHQSDSEDSPPRGGQDSGDGQRARRWFRAPFSLAHDKVYDSFAASYGLFRRLCQWLINAHIFGSREQNSTVTEKDPVIEYDQLEIELEDPDSLPYLKSIRNPQTAKDLVYARLDLSLAYPSVDRKALREVLIELLNEWNLQSIKYRLAESGNPFQRWFEGARPIAGDHPWEIMARDKNALIAVGEILMDALDQVAYAPWIEPDAWSKHATRVDSIPFVFNDLWERAGQHDSVRTDRTQAENLLSPRGLWPVGCHLEYRDVLEGRFGLPTGLAISGMLLNVALTPLDRTLRKLCDESEALYYLRYVDDIVLIATDPTALQEGLCVIHSLVSTPGALPGRFKLNSSKAKPESIRSFLADLDRAHSEDGRQPRPELKIPKKDYLTRANAEIFTTGIVRELSELADEALDERFGAAGIDRLEQLVALAVNNVDDIEVAKDARLSFAVNHIARSSWNQDALTTHLPADENSDSSNTNVHVSRLLWITEQALCQHPWRAKLWRAVLIMAARAGSSRYQKLGKHWLKKRILPLIRWDDGSESVPISQVPWERYDPSLEPEPSPEELEDLIKALDLPQDILDSITARRSHNSQLRASYHRACFWRQWASCIQALRLRLVTGRARGGMSDWTSFLSDEEVKEILSWMGSPRGFGEIASILYATESNGSTQSLTRFLWWWEAEAIHLALLAITPPSVKLLGGLGTPQASALRRTRRALYQAFTEEILPHHPQLTTLKRALANVLGYSANIPRLSRTRRRVALWLTYYWGDAFDKVRLDSHVSQKLLPRVDQDPFDWAALARVGLLHKEELFESPNSLSKIPKTWLPPVLPHTPEPQDPLWRAVCRLDAYHYLRRHALAVGREPCWREAVNWFNFAVETSATYARKEQPITLFEAMFCLNSSENPEPQSLVPALETDAGLAFEIGNALSNRPSGFVAPGTVRLHSHVGEALLQFRRALLFSDSHSHAPDYHAVSTTLSCLVERVIHHSNQKSLIYDVDQLSETTPAPHAMYLFPDVIVGARGKLSASNQDLAHRWRCAVLTLWLAEGGEHVLDTLYHLAPWQRPLSDRNLIRSSLLFDEQAWASIEEALGSKNDKLYPFSPSFSESPSRPSHDATSHRIVDVRVTGYGTGWSRASIESSRHFDIGPNDVDEVLRVRILQTRETPDWSRWFDSTADELATGGNPFLHIARELADFLNEIRNEMRMRVDGFEKHKASQSANHKPIHLAVLPECYVPWSYLNELRQFVRETGVGILAGVLFRELPRAVYAAPTQRQAKVRCIVNEAVLILPSPDLWRGKPSAEYVFRIRKPFASVMESGLIAFLSQDITPGTQWKFIPGTYWYRFSYPRWGYFSVAICSDLLDTYIWNWLRGRIQHLFVLSWNQDVDLFDQLSWTRSYELYANVVTVNHGENGGSIAWTPKRKHDKEIFRTHGKNISMAVTIALPLGELIWAQRYQFGRSVENAVDSWRVLAMPKCEMETNTEVAATKEDDTNQGSVDYKAPSPGYPRFKNEES